MGKFNQLCFGAVAILASSGAAMAETLTVSGWYAAEERSASMLRSLSVDRFDGDEGPSLVYEIERKLREARDRDRAPYFEVKSRYAQVEGVVHGDVRVRLDNENFTRKAKRCPDDIYSTKCKDDVKIEVDLYCVRRIVTTAANIRITRLSDDAVAYSRNLPGRHESESCEGDRKASDLDNVIATLLRRSAEEFVDQITPSARTDAIRVRESRSGMSKADGKQMKALISATKKSAPAACAGWREMEARGVAHPTLRFNLGLCAESAGELETALNYYRPLAAESRNADDAVAAVERIERRYAGEDDAAARKKGAGKP